MSSSTPATAPERVSLRAFWRELSGPGRWLLSTTAITTLGRGMVLPFTIVYLTEVRSVPLSTAGVLMGLIAVVALTVTGPGGVATDRAGPRRVLILSTLASSAAPLVMGFSTVVPGFAVAVGLMGLGWGLSWSAWNALIAAVVSGAARQRFYGVNFALVNLGIGLGGVVSGLFVDVHRPGTFVAIFLADAACLLVPLALLFGPLRVVGGPVPHPAPAESPATYAAVWRHTPVRWLAGLAFLTTFVGYGQMESGFPAFARQVALVSTRTLGLAFAANTAAIVVLQFAVLKRIDGRRRTRVLALMATIWAGAWGILAATGWAPGGVGAVAGVVAFTAIFGFGETMMQATMPSIVNDLADDHSRGRANSVNSAAFQLGAILGPVVAGFLLHGGHWVVYVLVMLAGCVLVALAAVILERLLPPAVNGVHTPS